MIEWRNKKNILYMPLLSRDMYFNREIWLKSTIFRTKYFLFQEGFLCPICKVSLPSPEALQAHYDSTHEQKITENR